MAAMAQIEVTVLLAQFGQFAPDFALFLVAQAAVLGVHRRLLVGRKRGSEIAPFPGPCSRSEATTDRRCRAGHSQQAGLDARSPAPQMP